MENLGKIGIDLWSIVLYLINYGLLLGVLGYFFYPKLLRVLDERRKTIRDNLASAEQLQQDLLEEVRKHKEEKDRMMKDLQEEKDLMRKSLHEEKNKMIQEMEEKREKMLRETKEEIVFEKKELIKNAEKEILSVMKKVIISVVSHKVPEQIVENSVLESWEKFQNNN